MTKVALRVTETGGRSATTRHIPPKTALAVGMPSTPAPKGWRWSLLTDLARLESGHTPSRRHPEYWGGSIPWIGIQDARANDGRRIEDTEEKTNELGIENSSARILPKNTVCLSRTASVGYVVVMGSPMATSQDFVNWVCSKQLDPNFLKYLLIAEDEDLLRFASGAVHSTIYFPEVKAFHICHPPIPDQRRIVDILDEAFESITAAKANTEKNLENAHALFESHLASVFTQRGEGWIEYMLGDLINIQNGYAFKSTDYTDAGYFVIRIGNVQDGEITLTNPRFIRLDKSGDKKLERFILNDGDILVSLTGNIGRVGIIQKEHLPAVLNQRVARITIKDQGADRDFVFRFLSSRTFRESLQEAGHGAAQQNVSTKEIESVRISIPKRTTEQRRVIKEFNNFAAETDRLESIYQHKLDALDALKKSLLHQAFTGQL